MVCLLCSYGFYWCLGGFVVMSDSLFVLFLSLLRGILMVCSVLMAFEWCLDDLLFLS